MAEPWTGAENDAIIEDYFSMLADDVAGHSYNKTEHRNRLRETVQRSGASIEYKHRNISAVLKALGEDWIPGYRPAFNFQMALADAVVSWLESNPSWLDPRARTRSRGALAEAGRLWIGPAPTLRNEPPPEELEQTLAVARKFDVAARDERNRALGRAGEELVLAHERATLVEAGRPELARRISWVSEEAGDGAGYDIASFLPDGRERLIEVKTTNGWERTPFHISRNELRIAEERRETWCLLRVHSFSREPRAFEIRPPLDRHVELTPTSFQASFR